MPNCMHLLASPISSCSVAKAPPPSPVRSDCRVLREVIAKIDCRSYLHRGPTQEPEGRALSQEDAKRVGVEPSLCGGPHVELLVVRES
jgi:hypothetical protein